MCFNVKFYVNTSVGVIIKVIKQNARCNDKFSVIIFIFLFINVTNCYRIYGAVQVTPFNKDGMVWHPVLSLRNDVC